MVPSLHLPGRSRVFSASVAATSSLCATLRDARSSVIAPSRILLHRRADWLINRRPVAPKDPPAGRGEVGLSVYSEIISSSVCLQIGHSFIKKKQTALTVFSLLGDIHAFF